MEIDENLCRAELSAAQRAKAIKRRREIWEAMRPNSGATCATIPRDKAGRPQEFASDTASASGESKAQVNRHLARADALGGDLDEVTGTSLDKGVELDALKGMDPDDRRELIQRAKSGENVSARSREDDETAKRLIRQAIGELARVAKLVPYDQVQSLARAAGVGSDVAAVARAIASGHDQHHAVTLAIWPARLRRPRVVLSRLL